MAGIIASLLGSVPPERRITHDTEAQQAVVSVLFTAAMLATIGRLAIRFRYHNRLFADDYALLCGCSSLIAAFTLTNIMFEHIYFGMSLFLGPSELHEPYP